MAVKKSVLYNKLWDSCNTLRSKGGMDATQYKDYIKYLLTGKEFQKYIENYATGTTIKNMSLKAMKEFEFELPDKNIQDQIAYILNTITKRIESNKHTNNGWFTWKTEDGKLLDKFRKNT